MSAEQTPFFGSTECMLSAHILRGQMPYNNGPHYNLPLLFMLFVDLLPGWFCFEFFLPYLSPNPTVNTFQPENMVQKWANTRQYHDPSL